jgi:hypothetical protein
MGKRYIVVEEKGHNEPPVFSVYKKGFIFNTHIKLFLNQQDAINFTLSLLRKDNSYSRVVFDTRENLKTDRTF